MKVLCELFLNSVHVHWNRYIRRSYCISSTKMQVFTQKRNPITGDTDWDVQNEDYDYHQEIARSAFADMMHDTERNKKYYKALQLAINKMHNKGKKANVLDIGTGTGLLSIMAVKSGADSVVACEAFKPMAECATKILQVNGVSDKIKLIPKRSTELTVGEDGDMKQRANILVTEVFDTELIGEGAISTFMHAQKNLLEQDCIVVPNSAIIYAQVVECPTLQKWNKLNDLADEDLKIILRTPQKMRDCAGSAAVHDVQLSQLPRQSFRELSEAIPVFYYDWTGSTKLVNDRKVKQKFTVTHTGFAQMVFMWWELIMDQDGKITLSCAPWWNHLDADVNSEYPQDTIPWRDHWMQAVYYFPQELTVTKDSTVTLIACQDEYSLWFYLEDDRNKNESYKRPICECGVHMAFSRTHVSYLNDGRRSKRFLSHMTETIDKDSIVLDLNGSSFQGLAAAKIGAKTVYIMENSSFNLAILNDYVKENSIENIQFIGESKIDLLNEVTHVICDPCFSNAVLPWENLKMAHVLLKIKENLKGTIKIIPQSCSFYAMPVEFLDLQKIRIPLGKCEGIDMSVFDSMVESSRLISDEELEAQPLWEYPCISWGRPQEILSLNMYELQQTYAGDKNFPILEPEGGTENACVNGFAVWCVWQVGGRSCSAGPVAPPEVGRRVSWDMHTRQAVKILKHAVNVSKTDQWHYQIVCDLRSGEFNLKLDVVNSDTSNGNV